MVGFLGPLGGLLSALGPVGGEKHDGPVGGEKLDDGPVGGGVEGKSARFGAT